MILLLKYAVKGHEHRICEDGGDDLLQVNSHPSGKNIVKQEQKRKFMSDYKAQQDLIKSENSV